MSELYHYGTKRHSGRYPWGSGKEPFQSEGHFLEVNKEMRKAGMSEKEIATIMGLSVADLRTYKTIAHEAHNADLAARAVRSRDAGQSIRTIAKEMGVSETKVKALLNPSEKSKSAVLKNTEKTLKELVDKKGPVDVGLGAEAHMGISRDRLNTAVKSLKEQGWEVYYVKTQQLGTGKETSIKCLCPPGMKYKDLAAHPEKIGSVYPVSYDGGHTFLGMGAKPRGFDPKRLSVRWAEEGGTDRDGVIEVRRGVPELSLGASNYAQVRIKVGDKHYLKGMAMYADDMPPGIDLRFNTNKTRKANKLDALKELKDDPDNPFGATTHPHYYLDKSGKRQQSYHNIVNEEGQWGQWSRNLASQFLSKQSPALAKKQLGIAEANRKAELEEILSLTNPAVRKKLLQSFADGADAAATHLKAARLPRQATQVLLPLPKIKPEEIYAPNFKHGETVSLVRYPHGGIFEIPTLRVNNKYQLGRKLIGIMSKDAVGIHPSVAERLSGADFDGDTAVVMPNNSGKIRTAPALKGLKNFDPKRAYPEYPGMKVMSKGDTGNQMGRISNLITDMTIKGASPDEIARAVRHSMTVIDAHKHRLNYKQSYIDNGIAALKKKYQPEGGAGTIISRSTADVRGPHVALRKAARGGPINKQTGELVWEKTGETYKKKVVDKATGEVSWVDTPALSKRPGMMTVKDANKLVSSQSAPIERVYASYANNMKALANKARLEMIRTPNAKWSPTARKAYASEVNSLKTKLTRAQSNAPRERQAQLYANSVVKAKRESNPDMDKDEIKRLKNQALAMARARFKASKSETEVAFTDREWQAVQAGAISHSMLEDLMNYANMDRVRQLAQPRTQRGLSAAKRARAKAMAANGYSQADIASALGASTTAVQEALS